MKACGQLHAPAALPPGKGIVVLTGQEVRVDPKTGLHAVAKEKKNFTCPSRESNPSRPASSLVTTLTELRTEECR